MLMSEAIRLGAMLRPQCGGQMFDDKGGSCAIGAAVEAAFDYYLRDSSYGMFSMSKHDESVWFMDTHAATCMAIERLNDQGGMTREAIADWLVESGNDFEVSPLPKIEVELSPADAAAIQEVTHG